MALKFRLNRYNWFGQKLLAQHQYGDIIQLYQYLTRSISTEANQIVSQSVRSTSEHLIYINGLALVKTSTRLDEVIYSLQQISFDKNSQYFLLLCQCLLYIGNYDSVVEICKQVINKELDATVIINDQDERSYSNISQNEKENEQQLCQERRKLWSESGKLELSFEFKSIFANINKNQLINEPRLWLIFGLCLELQRQLKSALFAFKVASNMALGNLNVQSDYVEKMMIASGDSHPSQDMGSRKIPISNCCTSHLKYVEFCIRHKRDFKSAIQTLNQVDSIIPQNYTVHPRLALLLGAQPSLSQTNFIKSIEIISNLEMHSGANRNPSSGYNKIAAKFNEKQNSFNQLNIDYDLSEASDENRSNLDYLLIKSYLIINSIVQNSTKSDLIYRSNLNVQSQSVVDNDIVKRAETLLEELKSSDTSCWDSPSLWNNLGVCYLIRRRFVACLSCFMKASQLNTLDWRINYNLALACIHVGLYTKALACLMAAKNLYVTRRKCSIRSTGIIDKSTIRVDRIINTLMAICFDKLNQEEEARTLFIEAIRPQKGVAVISLVNYLIFLHSFGSNEKQYVKLKFHLLDQLEQLWLQRNQNDCQFNAGLLEIARVVGEETLEFAQNKSMKKTYAWTKL